MPVSTPPLAALKEFLGPTTRHTRRVEIYESDGITRWNKDVKIRLKGGSVTVDYDRDERRGLDLLLDNSDGVLINAPGQFWYDKIIKVFRGVEVRQNPRLPKILVLSDQTGGGALAEEFREACVSLGFGDVRINPLASVYEVDVAPYDIIVALGGADQSVLLETAYNAGKSVFTFRESSTQFFNALYDGTTWAGSTVSSVYPASTYDRKNWFTNPSLEVDATDWGTIGTGGTFTRLTSGGIFGASRGQVVGAAGQAQAGIYCSQPTARGLPPLTGPLTGSIHAWVSSGSLACYARTRVYYSDATFDEGANVNVTLTASSQRIVTSPVTPNQAKTVTQVQTYVRTIAGNTAAFTMYGDGAMLEAASTSPDYFDGATTDTYYYQYDWTGTAGSSTSTRSLMIPFLVSPAGFSDPRTIGWSSFLIDADPVAYTYKAPASSLTGITGIAYAAGGTTNYTVTSGISTVNGKFVSVHYPVARTQFFNAQFRAFIQTQLTWLNPVTQLNTWEVQIGEFMIDRISEPHRPREMKITGRDYTKKCMLSKFSSATSFPADQPLEQLIAIIAGAAGITKRLLPATGITIGREFFFERNKSRWEAMKEICTAYNYEIFFDGTGYLVIRPFRDPSTTPPILWLETGREGQTVSYEKSTSDARIFNHILVTGESSDAEHPPVWAEARNQYVNSPTRISKIGDRYTEFSSAFVTTTAQAQELADSYLAINSLEEFELNFETLMLPWLEVGDIIGFIDPRPAPDDPTTFLLSSLSIGLGLGQMGGSARRITIIKDTDIEITPTMKWNELPATVKWKDLPSNITWNQI